MPRSDLLGVFGREFRRRPYLLAFTLALLGLALWAIIPFPKRTVKHVIVRARKIVEARDIERLKPLLAEDFASPMTGDRETTLEQLTRTFSELATLDIKLKRVGIELRDDRANALVDFYITWSLKSGVYSKVPMRGLGGEPSLANPLERCEVTLVKEPDGYWRITGAKYLGAVTGKPGGRTSD